MIASLGHLNRLDLAKNFVFLKLTEVLNRITIRHEGFAKFSHPKPALRACSKIIWDNETRD